MTGTVKRILKRIRKLSDSELLELSHAIDEEIQGRLVESPATIPFERGVESARLDQRHGEVGPVPARGRRLAA
jgi:hypothetical protein